MDSRVHVRCLPGEHMAPGCTMGRRKASGGSVMLWAMFFWETVGPAIPVDVTLTCTTYLSIVADHVHPFMETVFPDGCGLFQQDNAPCYKAKIVQEWFDEHNNHLNPIEHLWDVLDKQALLMDNNTLQLTGFKGSAANMLVPDTTAHLQGLVESMPRQVKIFNRKWHHPDFLQEEGQDVQQEVASSRFPARRRSRCSTGSGIIQISCKKKVKMFNRKWHHPDFLQEEGQDVQQEVASSSFLQEEGQDVQQEMASSRFPARRRSRCSTGSGIIQFPARRRSRCSTGNGIIQISCKKKVTVFNRKWHHPVSCKKKVKMFNRKWHHPDFLQEEGQDVQQEVASSRFPARRRSRCSTGSGIIQISCKKKVKMFNRKWHHPDFLQEEGHDVQQEVASSSFLQEEGQDVQQEVASSRFPARRRSRCSTGSGIIQISCKKKVKMFNRKWHHPDFLQEEGQDVQQEVASSRFPARRRSRCSTGSGIIQISCKKKVKMFNRKWHHPDFLQEEGQDVQQEVASSRFPARRRSRCSTGSGIIQISCKKKVKMFNRKWHHPDFLQEEGHDVQQEVASSRFPARRRIRGFADDRVSGIKAGQRCRGTRDAGESEKSQVRGSVRGVPALG
ncbi:hypothetical protein QTP70_006023 [Hemibagrus guttatus]|uniref:Uncharacterized protein n=1 Tax=Hemibagrus guttatus TaxID=175788 RepID=A0AAE0PV98_9TELE|nr:hypothetical protein QTP70_006023 [Hemibagrus guttatus]